MTQRLPPLNSLRAFVSAARLLSFTRAARELHVTQAAVSHQIKTLEGWLGVELFERRNRRLSLSPAGQQYLGPISRALDMVSDATAELRRVESTGPLTVSVLPSFAARWLVPRLGRFFQRCPEIDLRIDPNPEVVDFASGDVDVGIRYGRGDYPGLRSDRLLEEDIVPVCSPALAVRGRGLRRPEDLRHHPLLHDDTHGDWRTWLLAAGIEGVDPNRGTIFTDSSMLVQAATAGQGVALARSVLVADELAAGRLVRPFELTLPRDYAYYLVTPIERTSDAKIEAFRRWVLTEAQGDANRPG